MHSESRIVDLITIGLQRGDITLQQNLGDSQ